MRVVNKPVIVEYQARWPEEFGDICDRLASSFGKLATHIEHIGSTSVPGLAAKDVIDVQVSVTSLTPSEPLEAALQAAGFIPYRKESPAWDHVPPGSYAADPPQRWLKLFASAPPDQRRVHIHVRVAGSPNERYALLFRDFMRTHGDASGAWAIFKRELARIAESVDDYVEVKDPATDVVMVVAERWAADTGWTPHGDGSAAY
jgi:GrpB-like predicted nucleotidyltransferase (UPF0157 family)